MASQIENLKMEMNGSKAHSSNMTDIALEAHDETDKVNMLTAQGHMAEHGTACEEQIKMLEEKLAQGAEVIEGMRAQ